MEPCMEGLVDYVKRQIKCPECRAEHRIPYNEITGELPDPNADAIMQRCAVCSEKAYLNPCAHCDKKCCIDCKDAHCDILKREITRINNQIKRGVHRLEEILEQVGRNQSSLENNANIVMRDIDEIQRRLTTALKERTDYLKATVENYLVSEMRDLKTLKSHLELELINITSNSDLMEKHLNDESTKWDDNELMDCKDIFIKMMDFIRNYDAGSDEYNRRIRFSSHDSVNDIAKKIIDIGDLKLHESSIGRPSNGYGRSDNDEYDPPIRGLSRSKSDHRLVAEFRRREEDNRSPPLRRRFGEARYSREDNKSRTNFSRYDEDEDTTLNSSGSSRFRSRFLRTDDEDDFSGSVTNRKSSYLDEDEGTSNKSKTFRCKVVETEDASRGPLSGCIRLADSTRIIHRLKEMELELKKTELKKHELKEHNSSPSQSVVSKLKSRRSPLVPKCSNIDEDEIDRIKKENKALEKNDSIEIKSDSSNILKNIHSNSNDRQISSNHTRSLAHSSSSDDDYQFDNEGGEKENTDKEINGTANSPIEDEDDDEYEYYDEEEDEKKNNNYVSSEEINMPSNYECKSFDTEHHNVSIKRRVRRDSDSFVNRYLAKSKNVTESVPEQNTIYIDKNDENATQRISGDSQYPSGRSRYAALRDRKNKISRSKSSVLLTQQGIDDLSHEDLDHTFPMTPFTTRYGYHSKIEETNLSSWAKYLKTKYNGRKKGEDSSQSSSISNIIEIGARGQYLQKQEALLTFGSRGSQNGYFTWPRGIAVGPDNTIVVADSSNHRVQVFNEFAGVAVNRIGQYIIADRYNHRIQLFDPSGHFLRSFGSQGSSDGKFSYPWGLTTDALGFIYVCDKENHRVQVFQSDGSYVGKFGTVGTKPGQLEHPHYIAVSNTNRVIVSDSNNHRIQIFDINGKVLTTFGSEGTGDAQFKFPRGVSVDEQGYIFVADSGNNRIQIFNPDGTFLRSFGRWGQNEGEFKGLEGIAVNSGGKILIADRENHRSSSQVNHTGTFDSHFHSYFRNLEKKSAQLDLVGEPFLLSEANRSKLTIIDQEEPLEV
ncbi:TRIM71 [Lepeophtheirus salmonis]|uniref:TRIM71 n=1 Tax=Lepeophtheirus salmonis TaxID=72036 RepID=A0A7R8H244_LEPSM|nr:TRIM71 [Lepeophtheirus salmonis]CAF2820815.1 TRIM71 [Lepeophtheirus salmonis]